MLGVVSLLNTNVRVYLGTNVCATFGTFVTELVLIAFRSMLIGPLDLSVTVGNSASKVRATVNLVDKRSQDDLFATPVAGEYLDRGADIRFIIKVELLVCSCAGNVDLGMYFLLEITVCIFKKGGVEENTADVVEVFNLVSDMVSKFKDALLVTTK